jgi:hypothetical protein
MTMGVQIAARLAHADDDSALLVCTVKWALRPNCYLSACWPTI